MSCFLYIEDKEASHKINIDELYENRKRRDLKQLNIFDKILNRIHKRITFTGRNKKNNKEIWFNIPEFIFGEPTYDKGDCTGYLVAKLEDNGFFVKYLHPNTLFISWGEWIPSYVRTEFKKKTGIVIDEKGNVIEQKKQDQDDQDPMSNGMNSISHHHIDKNLQNSKSYTSINKYKPTGNLVYTPEMMEQIEKKVSFA
jgi:hypothetical protein